MSIAGLFTRQKWTLGGRFLPPVALGTYRSPEMSHHKVDPECNAEPNLVEIPAPRWCQ
jgi:hypothetical protein